MRPRVQISGLEPLGSIKLVPGHITATSLGLFLLIRHSARTLSSLAQFFSGMHSIGRLSRAIPWTSSGIACCSLLPLYLVISVISQLKGVCWLSSRSRRSLWSAMYRPYYKLDNQDLPTSRRSRYLLNHFRTGQGSCLANLHRLVSLG